MLVSLKYLLKEWTGGCQDHLVRLHLLTILTGQGYISKLFVISKAPKGTVGVLFEVIPLQTKFF